VSAATTSGELHAADLVVLSHLRWYWVWQRPQHLISRLSKGRRTRSSNAAAPLCLQITAGRLSASAVELAPDYRVGRRPDRLWSLRRWRCG
jgi:hypothetical protein